MNKTLAIVLSGALAAGLCLDAGQAFAQKKKGKAKKPAASAAAPAPVVQAAPAAPAFIELDEPKLDSMGYNALSVRPVHVSDIMYRMVVWRRLDLQEKCNEPFFAKGNELSSIIMDAVARGELQAYLPNDSVNRRMSKEKFLEKLNPAAAEVDPNAPPAAPEIDEFTGEVKKVETGSEALMGKQLYLFEIREDLIFDRQRSRMLYDIQSITMFIPKEFDVRGLTLPVASFRYVDLAKLFKRLPNARWYNEHNRAEDKKLSDAFDLRLFCSRIIKLSNPRDNQLQDISAYNANDKTILIASQQMEYELVETENELWDY